MKWQTIKKFPLYEINTDGQIRNKKTKQIKKYQLNKDGYYHVLLYKNSKIQKPTNVTLHRIIAETFIDNPHNYNCINHIDEIKTNNSIGNLEWCSQKQNRNFYLKNKNVNSMKPKIVQKLDLKNNIVCCYSSLREASIKEKINLTTLCRSIKSKQIINNYIFQYEI